MKTTRRQNARSGTVALEFALIMTAFFGLTLLILQLGFVLYAQTAMDYAAREAARQMQTGQANPTSRSGFQSVVFCPFLAAFLNCANVQIVLQPVTSFQAATTPAAPFNAGSAGSLMLLQATYTTGLPVWPLNVMTIVGTAAYQNEF
ncbi:MAG TPA: TadE/TadG family type IV pilus assembly protein [Rhodopila sp.]|nr:TadE/TadG family type IV pilus assembly protein [Rhodopila sp.]